MGEWVRCTACALLHTRRPEGRCPRCGASTGAAAPGALEPLPTVLAPAAGEAPPLPPRPLAPARAPAPRVWTVFLAFLLSLAASVAATVVVMAAASFRARMRGTFLDAASLATIVEDPGVLLAILGLTAVATAALAVAGAAMGREPLRSRLAVTAPASPASAMALACAGGLGLSLAFDALTSALRVRPSGALELLGRMLRAGAGPGDRATAIFLLSVLVIAVLAPLGEELLYRGYMQRRLVQRWGAVAGVVVTSALFGLAHLDAVQSPFAMVTGLLLGWIAVRAGSIVPALVGHAAINGWAVLATRLDLSPRAPTACAVVGAVGLVLLVATAWLGSTRLRPALPAAGAAPPSAPPAPFTPA